MNKQLSVMLFALLPMLHSISSTAQSFDGTTNLYQRAPVGDTPENLAACLNFIFTWREIPIVYYGTEMQFKRGFFADIEASDINRSNDNTGRSYYGDVIDQASSHIIYQHLKNQMLFEAPFPPCKRDHGAGMEMVAGMESVMFGNRATVKPWLALPRTVPPPLILGA